MFVAPNGAIRRPAAYLAGWEMFYPDGWERGKRDEEISRKYGIEGVFPGNPLADGTPDLHKPLTASAHEMEHVYFKRDINHLRGCDMVIANLNNLRGQQPDSGTVFECGSGYAMGYPVYGFVEDITPYVDRIPAGEKKRRADGLWEDTEGIIVEDYGLALGMMLAVPITLVEGDFEACCKKARADFDKQLIANGYDPYVVE